MSKRFIENYLGLTFALGAWVEDDESDDTSKKQKKAYDELQRIFEKRAMAELSVSDPTVSDDFRWVPVELCECEWESSQKDEQVVYGVWFQSNQHIEPDLARKLRAMAQEAYDFATGSPTPFMGAKLQQTWQITETSDMAFDA